LIAQAFRRLSQNLMLFVLPLVLDAALFVYGLSQHGFGAGTKMSFKIALTVGLPSVGQILDRPVVADPLTLPLSGGAIISGTVLLAMLVFLVVSAFIQAGYVGLLQDAAGNGRTEISRFFQYGSEFFVRFFLLNLLIFVFFLIAGGLLIAVFRMAGVFLFLLVFLILRVMFVYLEFTIVTDNLPLGQAFSRSLGYFRRRVPETVTVIAAILILNFVFALLMNAVWQLPVFLVLTLIWLYLAAGLQLALMMSLQKIQGR